jgi:hypothetical protein
MRDRSVRCVLPMLLAALLIGCQDGTGPGTTTLELPEPPDLTAAVFQSTHESGYFPGGYVSQYAIWIGTPGATTPNAGLVVGAATPVFVRSNGRLVHATAAAIRPGDLIQVWREASVSYGAVQAPPGQPCYLGRQVIIVR